MAIDASKYGKVIGEAKPQESTTATIARDYSKYGKSLGAPPAEQDSSLRSFVSKDLQGVAKETDRPSGVAGFVADAFQGTLGSGGVSGLAQAPARPVQTAVSAKTQENIHKSRLDLTKSADNYISLAQTEKDPTRKKKLLELASHTIKESESLDKQAEDINEATPQSTSNIKDIERIGGQAINTALTVAPFSSGGGVTLAENVAKKTLEKPTLAGKVFEGAKTGGTYGAGGGLGTALSKEEDAEDTVRSVAVGAGIGTVLGGGAALAGAGIKGAYGKAQSFIEKRKAGNLAQEAEQASLLSKGAPDSRVATKTLQGGKVVDDTVAKELVRQGVQDSDVALIKSGTPSDRAKMLKMLDTRIAQRTNARATERASDVAGDTFVEKIAKPLQEQNKKSAELLDTVANKLAGKKVDATPAVDSFVRDLETAGVKINKNGTLDFTGSDFDGIAGAQSSIRNAWSRALNVAKSGDALQLHRAKRYIDEVVDYGKSAEGLSGRAQRMLKNFRHNADAVLDSNFEEYNKANTVFAETISELNKIGESMGRRFKLGDSFASAKAGVVLRRLFSNTQSRGQLLQVLESAQKVAKKYGAKIDEDVITQAKFADILEKVLGSEAPTSFLGSIEKGVGHAEKVASAGSDLMRGNVLGAVAKGGKHLYEATRGINEEELIKQLRAILVRRDGIGEKAVEGAVAGKIGSALKKIGGTKLPAGLSIEDVSKGDLLSEARKYKSAEEFANNAGAIRDNYDWSYLDEMKATKESGGSYSHSDFANLSKLEKTHRGKESRTFYRAGEVGKNGDIWLTPQEAGAAQYGDSGGTKVGEYKVATQKPLVLQDVKTLEKVLGEKLDSESSFTNSPTLKQKVIDYAKANGYDSVLMPDSFPDGAGGMESLVVWDKNLVKTKSQLTDIWEKANRP